VTKRLAALGLLENSDSNSRQQRQQRKSPLLTLFPHVPEFNCRWIRAWPNFTPQ
jgi:hypothetical protein